MQREEGGERARDPNLRRQGKNRDGGDGEMEGRVKGTNKVLPSLCVYYNWKFIVTLDDLLLFLSEKQEKINC